MPEKKVDLSVIVLSFNTKDLLRHCLSSVFKSDLGNYHLQVIVADNASSDGSVEMLRKEFPKVILVESKENYGFAKGNNAGLTKAKGRYILFLNSDTEVFPETLRIMLDYMERNPKVGLATCRVEFVDGSLDPASHRGFPTPGNAFTYFSGLEKLFPHSKVFSGYHLGYLDLQTSHQIDTPTGAFYLVRKKVIDEVGSFDERYFMYAEDIDLSLRIKKAGWQIMYLPLTKIIHFKKQSGRAKKEAGEVTPAAKEIREKTIGYFFNSMKLFYDLHYKDKYPWVTRQFVLGAVWLFTQVKLWQNRLQ
jgi:hypothetical protein